MQDEVFYYCLLFHYEYSEVGEAWTMEIGGKWYFQEKNFGNKMCQKWK